MNNFEANDGPGTLVDRVGVPSQSQRQANSQIRRFDLIAAILVSLTVGFSAGKIWVRTTSRPAEEFHRIFYGLQFNTYWRGVPIQKNPLDTWIYQEILSEVHPDVLVETGTLVGGSAYYFASLFDLAGQGRVISVDLEQQPDLPRHPRITYLNGSSTSPEMLRQIRALISPGDKVMVVLDSDHHAPHVQRELEMYAPLVTVGQYLVVEDTNIDGHPVYREFGPGPAEAVDRFLADNRHFVADKSREKFLVSFFPGGWLKRIR